MDDENEIVPAETRKKAWSTPTFEVLELKETAGAGGGGPDFGSEVS